MTSHEYPYTFTEAMSRVSQTVKVTSKHADELEMENTTPNDWTYILDDKFKLKNLAGLTPAILKSEIDSMWRTIE